MKALQTHCQTFDIFPPVSSVSQCPSALFNNIDRQGAQRGVISSKDSGIVLLSKERPLDTCNAFRFWSIDQMSLTCAWKGGGDVL